MSEQMFSVTETDIMRCTKCGRMCNPATGQHLDGDTTHCTDPARRRETTPEPEIEAIRARWDAATPGPWNWDVNLKSHSIQLEGQTGFRETVMCFERWGMQAAQPIVRELRDGAFGNGSLRPALDYATTIPKREHHASWAQTFVHPDLDAIAHAPTDIRTLFAHINQQAAQIAEARAYADKLAQGLPMLPKDVELVNQANARMATELLEIENVVRSFCPIENSEDCIDDEPRAAFICCNEDADRIIEADTLAEAIAGAHGCWETMAEEAATLRTQLAEARARAKYWEDGAKFLGESLDVLQQYCQAHRIGLGGGNLAVIVTEHCDALQTQLAAAERVVERVRGIASDMQTGGAMKWEQLRAALEAP